VPAVFDKWLQGEIVWHWTATYEVRPGDSHRTLLVKSKALPEVDIDQQLGFELPISCIPKVMGPCGVHFLIFFQNNAPNSTPHGWSKFNRRAHYWFF